MTAYRLFRDAYEQYRRVPEVFTPYLGNAASYARGFHYADRWEGDVAGASGADAACTQTAAGSGNPLHDYFINNNEGPGIWKWEHYFNVYARHFSPWVGRAVDILEIGVFSGGSLKMWRSYFGAWCRVYGVDIEPACKAYEEEGVTITIGDQKDRDFWREFKRIVPGIDVLVDDGGHKPEQQMVTLEEMLPHIRPGGVYLCEDIHGFHRETVAFACGLVNALNQHNQDGAPTAFQKSVHSIHFYPYLLVIEKHATPPARLHAPKHGTEWQPFFDRTKKGP